VALKKGTFFEDTYSFEFKKGEIVMQYLSGQNLTLFPVNNTREGYNSSQSLSKII